jgi:hypothetical protein
LSSAGTTQANSWSFLHILVDIQHNAIFLAELCFAWCVDTLCDTHVNLSRYVVSDQLQMNDLQIPKVPI